MSDSGKTPQDQGFLSRWSQRKQEARESEPKQDTPLADGAEPVGLEVAQPENAEPEFDLSTLPKLEELTGTTDITSFLRKGVPEHLRNAALRKSWALDPAIRNYVNPALEYAYDWNTPGGVPGSGELAAGFDVARMVSQIMGDGPPAEPADASANLAGKPDVASASAVDSNLPLPAEEPPAQSARPSTEGNSSEVSSSPIAEAEHQNPVALQQPVRRHGTAKPIG
ncbi:MAG: DUF3306 domain-containing protein [bacterium]|nr:DUF3306 domain-containing protein [bacterium]